MDTKTDQIADRPVQRRFKPWPVDHDGIPDSEPSFWGGNWVTRFAANFADPVETTDHGNAMIEDVVNRVVELLPENERRIVIDYFILGLSRKTIAERQDLREHEVDAVRSRAERRLRGMLAGFVEKRFGLTTAIDSDCPYCRSPQRKTIDDELSRRDPGEAWGSLRRRINAQFGLNIKRVQTLMTHCRFHGVKIGANPSPAPEEQNHA